MATNIKIEVDEELKNVLQEYAKLENKTLSDIVLEAIKEKIKNNYDYLLAMHSYESVDLNDTTTLEDLCVEAKINYESL